MKMGKKLTIYMIDGKEYGPRTIEIGNWSGKAIYTPRNMIMNILSRNEFDNPGVYFLKSNPENEAYSEKVYIGEAENIKARIKTHLTDSKRDFHELVFFISKDELLTKAHIKYLESRIIQIAKISKSAEIENTQTPSLPSLHEADISDMEYFLDQIKLILPVTGLELLKPSVIKIDRNNQHLLKQEATVEMWRIKTKNYNAKMYESEEGFIVTEGSEANLNTSKSLTQGYKNLKKKLITSGSLKKENDKLLFAEDVIFNSPSAASNIVLGRQSAGPIQWINSKGKTYKEVQEKEIKEK